MRQGRFAPCRWLAIPDRYARGKDSTLAASIGNDRKGTLSIVVYAAAIPLSFVQPQIACACYVMVAVMWLLPDPRIEKAIGQ